MLSTQAKTTRPPRGGTSAPKFSAPQAMLDEPVANHLRRDFTAVLAGLTIAQTLDCLREQQLGEKIVYLYVVDDHLKLVGVLPTRRLLMSKADALVADVMLRRVVTIPMSASVLEACEFFIQYRFLALPVVDDDGKLAGVVDVGLFTDEVFDVAEEQSLRDVFQLIGVHVDHRKRPSTWAGFGSRFPWLMCNIVAGVLCALVAGQFEEILDRVILLAMFVPVVLALGESVSMQSTTLALQALHHAPVSLRALASAIGRELAVAALLGLASGAVVAAVAWLWKGNLLASGVIAASITISIMTACALGVLVPTAIRALRVDPQIAAGPIVLACADVATLSMYFALATLILG